MCDRVKLAVIAREEAEKPYNGKLNNCVPNIQDIVALFPKWSVDEGDMSKMEKLRQNIMYCLC